MDTNYFRLNSALNGGSVWQNNCKKIVHTGSRFDNNTSERGSAGIEMNQITSTEIASCTFSSGKSAKGSGLYLQVRISSSDNQLCQGNRALNCMPFLARTTRMLSAYVSRLYCTLILFFMPCRGCRVLCVSVSSSSTQLISAAQSSEDRPLGTSQDQYFRPIRQPRLEGPFMTRMPRCAAFSHAATYHCSFSMVPLVGV